MPRTLVASPRKLDLDVWLCALYEFEDIIRAAEGGDLFCPEFPLENSLHYYYNVSRVARNLLKYTGVGSSLNPVVAQLKCDKKYDLFFVCLRPTQFLFVNSIKHWRRNCQIAVCYIEELWPNDIRKHGHIYKILNNFDYVFLGQHQSVSLLEQIIKRPCYYLPVGVDSLRFCPYTLAPPRVIDFYSLGRRSEQIHNDLLKHTREQNFFYVYDTLRSLSVLNYIEHRDFIASLAKRSRYFFVHRPKFNVSSKFEGQQEVSEDVLGSRFLEGAAAGTVMVGKRPTGAIFNQHIDWLDAVIDIPSGAGGIVQLITQLDAEPERLTTIRRANVFNCLMRHDWIYRWEEILKKVGLPPGPELQLRKQRLKDIASYVRRFTLD